MEIIKTSNNNNNIKKILQKSKSKVVQFCKMQSHTGDASK